VKVPSGLVVWVVFAASNAGCAALFQEHLSSEYAGTNEPRCSTSKGWYLWDGLIVAGDAAILLADGNTIPNSNEVIGVAVLSGVVHFFSMIAGSKWASECEAARHAYDENTRALMAAPPPVRRRLRSVPASVASGAFFCASSPTVVSASICAHGEAACEQARNAALGGVADLAECAPTEIVFCFQPELGSERRARCAASLAACAAQHDAVVAAVSDTSTIGTCVDIK
jgi:hypothetical protein